MPFRRHLLTLAAALVATLTTSAAIACRPKTGPDRFLGTYRWRLMFGHQAVTLGRHGKATYVIVTPGEGDNDRANHDSLSGTYRVAGDTAFVAIDWREPADSGKVLPMLLRGDTLVMLMDGTSYVRD